MKAEQYTDVVTYHGEGPIWDSVAGVLRWVDMLNGDILTMAPDGSIGRQHVGTIAAAMRPRAGGGLVVAVGQLVVEPVIAELGGDVGVAARQVVKVILGQPPEPHGGIPGRPGRGGLCTHVYSSRGHDCLCEPPRTSFGNAPPGPPG